MALKISEEAAVQMPMKTVASLITLVAIGTWAFFGIQEKLNSNSTKLELMEKDLIENTAFRIGWPRGTLGSLPADSEQFMLIEELYKQVEKLQTQQIRLKPYRKEVFSLAVFIAGLIKLELNSWQDVKEIFNGYSKCLGLTPCSRKAVNRVFDKLHKQQIGRDGITKVMSEIFL